MVIYKNNLNNSSDITFVPLYIGSINYVLPNNCAPDMHASQTN